MMHQYLSILDLIYFLANQSNNSLDDDMGSKGMDHHYNPNYLIHIDYIHSLEALLML